ncbi:MAG: hypothetical protein GY772_06390 [bacterium]|nr:hypothetical protein [bacterium]
MAPPFPARRGDRKRPPAAACETGGPRAKASSPGDRTTSPATLRRRVQMLPGRAAAQPRSDVITKLLDEAVKEQPRGAWQPSLAASARSPSDRTRIRRAIQGPDRAEAQAAAEIRPRPSVAPGQVTVLPRREAAAAEAPTAQVDPATAAIPRRWVSPSIRRRGARSYPHFVALLSAGHVARRTRAKGCVPPGPEGDRLLGAFAPFTNRGKFAVGDTLGEIDWTAVQNVVALEPEEYWAEAQSLQYNLPPLRSIRDAIEAVGYPSIDAVLAGQYQHLGGTMLDLLVSTAAVRMGLRSTIDCSEAVGNKTYGIVGSADQWPSRKHCDWTDHTKMRIGNLIETYAAVLFMTEDLRTLRSIVLLLTLVQYRKFCSKEQQNELIARLCEIQEASGSITCLKEYQ